MKEIIKIFCTSIFLFLITLTVEAKAKILSLGSSDAKVTVKVFSSLTCPACANFHSEIYYDLKKDFFEFDIKFLVFFCIHLIWFLRI